jgi:hypothetical protein
MAAPTAILYADHFVAAQMGVYTREIRFAEKVILQKVQILGRAERPQGDSAFEGKTFPDVRTMSLSMYAADKASAGSTMPRLRGDSPGTFAPGDRLETDCLVVKGEYLRLSIVVYGQKLEPGEAQDAAEHELASSIAAHLRPETAFPAEKLDLADYEGADELDQDEVLDAADDIAPGEASASISLVRGLSLGSPAEADARVAEQAMWVHKLGIPTDREITDEEPKVIQRLEELADYLSDIAKSPLDASAGLVVHGPSLARSLLLLNERCIKRVEFKPLRSAFKALAAALCAAPTAAEVLRSGGLAQLVSVIKDQDFMSQSSLKLSALQALSQLCSHAVGMEAFLGWSTPAPSDSVEQASGYETIVALAADGSPGCLRLEQTAVVLLRRAAFYMALARLDDSCARLVPDKRTSDDSAADAGSEAAVSGVVEALTDVAAQFEELSTPSCVEESLLDDACPSAAGIDSLESSSTASTSDPFAHVHPQLYGFLESFLAGRRLVPALNLILRRLRGETKLPELSSKDRLAVFAPLRRLVCAVLACVGGAQFLAADAPALTSFVSLLDGGKAKKAIAGGDANDLPAVPRFPAALAQSMIGAPQLAALVSMHVRAIKLVLTLASRTRQRGTDGLLPEPDALKLLCALQRLCSSGSAGRDSVVCAFRSVFLVEWLLRQLEGRLKEVASAGSAAAATLPCPSLRHLVAILHALTLADPSASVAERFGGQIAALCGRTLELLELRAADGDAGDGGAGRTSLEFALDSDGPEGGLGRAVRVGRHSADAACIAQLRELSAQLRPWQQAEGEAAPPVNAENVPTLRLLTSLRMARAPRSFKRSVDEAKINRLSVKLGGYCGVEGGVEVAEVDFVGDAGEHGEVVPDERFPPSDLAEIPLLTMRLLRRRAARSARDAVEVVLTTDSASTSGSSGLAVMVPVLIRCLSALNLNLEALILQEDKTSVDEIYATQQAHAHLLEAALQACFHMLKGLRTAGLSQYRSTDLLHALLLLADRLTSNIVGLAPCSAGTDPEFRLLWRHCLVWVCCVFRVWVQSFPDAAAGQLLQPLIRHTRVLSWHFAPGLLLLGTCGVLQPLLPPLPCTFKFAGGPRGGVEVGAGEQHLQSHQLLFPESMRAASLGHITAIVKAPPSHSPFSKAEIERTKMWGQLWGKDWDEDEDWDIVENGPKSVAYEAVRLRDPLVRALSRKAETGVVAAALALVGHVNSRRERLSMDDLGELASVIAQCAVTSDAFLHLTTVRVLEKLTAAGVPVISLVLTIGETALGADAEQWSIDTDAQLPTASPAVRDPRDARAVSRVLMLLTHFGQRGVAARSALVEHRAETLCLSVLAAHASALPATAATQAIRVLGLMFCQYAGAPRPGQKKTDEFEASSSAASSLLRPSVPKCRMVTKALSLLLNRSQEDGSGVGPAAMGASLELLLRLSRDRSMCLNLLFSATEESTVDTSKEGNSVAVSVSCAFRLSHCSSRLSRALTAADEVWENAVLGSEGESEAEEVLQSWLHVGELLISLCQTVALNCPTVSVFLAVMSPSGCPPERVDQAVLQSVLSDVNSVLTKLCLRSQHGESAVPMRAATLVGNIRALMRQLDECSTGPPPTTLPHEEFCPSWLVAPADEAGDEAAGDQRRPSSSADQSSGSYDDVLLEAVALFSALSELEADAEWKSVAELDAADAPADGTSWVFDAVMQRKKRKEKIEKAESDRQAKRLKQAQSQRTGIDRDAASRDKQDERGVRKEAPPANKESRDRERSPPRTATEPAKEAPGASAETTVAVPKKEAATVNASSAQALQKFLKEHPHFMRVLNNHKKSLSDPRVKSMFLTELNAHPEVKAFLEKQGLAFS